MHGVEHVARLGAKFEGASLLQLNRLGEGHIDRDQTWTGNAVASCVAELSGRRHDKSRRIKPFKHRRMIEADRRACHVGAQGAAGSARNVSDSPNYTRRKWCAAG